MKPGEEASLLFLLPHSYKIGSLVKRCEESGFLTVNSLLEPWCPVKQHSQVFCAWSPIKKPSVCLPPTQPTQTWSSGSPCDNPLDKILQYVKPREDASSLSSPTQKLWKPREEANWLNTTKPEALWRSQRSLQSFIESPRHNFTPREIFQTL